MVLLVVAFIASLLPSIGLFLWLRSIEGDEEFKGICSKGLIQGFLTIFPVVACSMAFALTELGLSLLGMSGMPKAAYHRFIVLALSEELCKCFMFHRLLQKYERNWSWLDYIILMVLVGLGFGLIEDFFYAVGADAITMLVRGVTAMHGGYGFIMGFFLGMGKKTGDKKWSVLSVVVPWLLHGAYDFGLSDEFFALGENTAFLSVSLAIFALVTLVVLVVFFLRHKNDERFRAPMATETDIA
ncbi:MAG: PrsW family intramembrane metalloprotease [Atopobiaceae bacterium]|nr:PrsW family intramembrane metalloprotease [Atopobiaceae bacterium]MBR1829623.1 PrsW family intramembrane metalloprotease [Atopobiaceae bacterium]